MKFRPILLSILTAGSLASCSTVYRTGQTPDDVYYSPARETDSYVNVDKQERGSNYQQDDYSYNSDDRYLRMRVRDRNRWSYFDDYGMNDYYSGYNSYNYGNYGYGYGPSLGLGFSFGYSPFSYGSYWNNYYAWNNYYNPYCGGYIIVNPKTNPAGYSRVRNFSLAGYTNSTYSNTNLARTNRGVRLSPPSGYNNTNSFGNSLRRVFSGNSNGNSRGRDSYYSPSSSDRPSRTYTPSNNNSNNSSSAPSRSSGSSGSSGGSSGSSGGGVSRPSRGG